MPAVAAPPPALVFQLPAGEARRTLWVRRPAGVVLLTRMDLARGVQATVMATIPGVAGVGVDTRTEASNRCRRAGERVVCVRSQEWCPMPAARWRVTVVKRAGPAGPLRLDFRVGEPA